MATATAKATASAAVTERITIQPLNLKSVKLAVVGTAPLMQNRFAHKAIMQIIATQEGGTTSKSKKVRKARDFDEDFYGAMHMSSDRWVGVPASAFRNAAIDACRMAGFKMTHAKMSIFIQADGLDEVDGTPLVKLHAGKPEKTVMPVRNQTGVVDLRSRPMWREWSCDLVIQYDADQFTAEDVANLIERAGAQVGIGEGRPFSKSSAGMGFGTFSIKKG